VNLLMNSVGVHTGAGSAALRGRQFELESKAMRKVDVGQDIVLISEGSTIANGATVTWGGRMLVKLH